MCGWEHRSCENSKPKGQVSWRSIAERGESQQQHEEASVDDLSFRWMGCYNMIVVDG